MVRDDLEQSLQDWRAMRRKAVADDAQAAAADGDDDADAEAEDASHELQSSEQPHPDNFVRPLKRLPKGHLVALAHAEVLLDRTLAKLDAHYDECFLRDEQERIRAQVVAEGAVTDAASLQPLRRRNACQVDPKLLEAHISKRSFTNQHTKRIGRGSSSL